MRRLVADLADRRPIFAPPPDLATRLEAVLPRGWEVVVVDAGADGVGDGAAAASPAALQAVAGAEVYLGFGIPAGILRAGPDLRWVHSGAAGVGGSLSPEMLASEAVFTNSAGIHGPPVAETVMGYLFYFARGLDHALTAQRQGRWDKRPFDAADAPVRELSRSTVGVVGLGGLGREVARRALAMGASVVGTRRRPEPVPELPDVRVLTGDAGLRELLDLSHYVVLTLPETDETRGLVGGDELAVMGPDAVLVNVGRGGLVDEVALLEALETRAIRGAALDVFATEPLPAGHPLWTAPGVLITPHVSAYTDAFWERELELIAENIRRYVAGERLRNVVDKEAGY
ncbi:MAG TPA: D-2-hydroxyacid dehydrogenase [Longimicrobiales bacterium]|nr:D-2-hydroxyacid dehydrogenase [Longimicrobiales bacterium]